MYEKTSILVEIQNFKFVKGSSVTEGFRKYPGFLIRQMFQPKNQAGAVCTISSCFYAVALSLLHPSNEFICKKSFLNK